MDVVLTKPIHNGRAILMRGSVQGRNMMVIRVERIADDGIRGWRGTARWPMALEHRAREYFGYLHDDESVEDMLREWGGEGERDEFQEFVAGVI